MGETLARFSVGQIIHHKLFDYRGIIFDVDPVFSGSEEWYEEVAKSRPPKDRPWYHVLVDGADHTTYVSERNLEESEDERAAIDHPLFSELFRPAEDGTWKPQREAN